MKQATISIPYTFEISDVEVPQIAEDEVLLKVNCLGICGSDMQIYKGLHKYMELPVIPGHEFSATIVEVGAKVRGFLPGQRVTMDPKITCGMCYPCKIGRPNACESIRVMGVHAPGAAAEYIIGKPQRLHTIPEDMADDVAALTEPLAVAVGSLNNCADALHGANVAIMGAGTIGNLTAQAAHALGAGKVLLCDIDAYKLGLAGDCGIDCLADTSGTTLGEAIRRNFGEYRKADIIIDCTGALPSFQAILDASRGSSLIVVTGLFKQPVSFEVPRVQRRDIRIIGSHMYVQRDFAQALQLLAEKKICTDRFISRQYPFSRIADAFDDTAKNPGQILKTMIYFDEPISGAGGTQKGSRVPMDGESVP